MNSFATLWRHSQPLLRLVPRRLRLTRGASRYQVSGMASTTGLSRIEVRPPSLRHAPAPIMQRVLFWLMAPSPQEASPPLNRLPGVQCEFRLALADISGEEREALMDRINRARSLRELWHMRIDLYTLIAVRNSEFEAAQRLARLNHHFPTRAPRHGMVGVGT